VIAGDGIGPEVVAVTQEVIAATGLELDYQDVGISASRYLREGLLLTDDDVTLIRGCDAARRDRLANQDSFTWRAFT
jgi:3-isopropylmalate dehydrogenase